MGGDKYVWVYITSWAMVWTLHAQGKTPWGPAEASFCKSEKWVKMPVCSVLAESERGRERGRKNEVKNGRYNLDILHSKSGHNHDELKFFKWSDKIKSVLNNF